LVASHNRTVDSLTSTYSVKLAYRCAGVRVHVVGNVEKGRKVRRHRSAMVKKTTSTLVCTLPEQRCPITNRKGLKRVTNKIKLIEQNNFLPNAVKGKLCSRFLQKKASGEKYHSSLEWQNRKQETSNLKYYCQLI